MGEKIEIIISGTGQNKEKALYALLKNGLKYESTGTFRAVLADLSRDEIIRLAQLTHGEMYRLMRTHC
jgi:hypothetical protein